MNDKECFVYETLGRVSTFGEIYASQFASGSDALPDHPTPSPHGTGGAFFVPPAVASAIFPSALPDNPFS